MAVKFANLASTTLSSAITNSATSIAVADASLFPTLGSGDYFYATIGEGSGSEIVKVTAISSNTLTVTRAQDGTTASAFSSGETIALRVVAAALDDIASQAQSAADTESVSIDGDTMTGALKVSMPHSTTYSDSLTWNEQSFDALKVINGNSTTSADQFSSIFMQASGGGNATARIVLRNDNSGNGRLYFQMRSGAHTGVTQPKMLITDDGYVTISDNANTYNERLFVDGTLRAEDGIKVGATRIVTSGRALQNITSITSTGDATFSKSSGSTFVTASTVGAGRAGFRVDETSTNGFEMVHDGADNAFFISRRSGSSTVIDALKIDRSTGDLSLFESTGSSENLYWDASTSRLGIGTDTPLDILHLTRSGESEDARVVIDGDTGYDAELKFSEGGNTKYTVGYDAATTSFVIGTTNVDTQRRFVIDSSGNVDINGTTLEVGDGGTNGVIDVKATSNAYYKVNGSTALTLTSSSATFAGAISSGAITSTGLLHLDRSTGTNSSTTGTTFLKIDNYVGSDLQQQKSFIDFIFQDDNTNETPQVRIGAEVGQNGDANTQEKEGSGAFVVYTNNAESQSGDAGASLAERFRVDYAGNATLSGSISASEQSVFTGNAISGTPNSNAQIVAADSGVAGIAIQSNDGGQGYLWFGDNTNNAVGRIYYNHSTDKVHWRVGGTDDVHTLDSSGNATFAGHISLPDSKYLRLGADNDFIIYHDGATNYIQTVKQDSDLIIRGNDGGTNFNALTIDMSAGGNATFAGTINSGAITSSGLITGDSFLSGYGTASSPAFQVGDTNSGFYDSGSDSIGVALGGAKEYEFLLTQFNLQDNDLVTSGIVKAGTGSVSAPSFQVGDNDSGFYDSGANEIGVTLGGALEYEFTPTQFNMDSNNLVTTGTLNSGAITSSGNITSGNDVFVPNGRFFRFTAASSNSSGGFLFGNSSGAGGSITFKRNSDSAAVLTLNADQSATFAGTLSSGAITSTGNMSLSNTGTGNNITINRTDSSASAIFHIGSSRGYVGTTTDHIFEIRQNDTPAITIDTAGNTTVENNLVVDGNLTVSGTTTTIDTANLNVEDKNITLNYSTGDSSATADGAGITIQDAVNSTTNATILWDGTNDEWDFSHGIHVDGKSIFRTNSNVDHLTIRRSTGDSQSLRIGVDDEYTRFYSEQDETGRYGGYYFYGTHNGTNRSRLEITETDGDVILFNTTGTSKWKWDAVNERQGIGTSSPNYRMHVYSPSGQSGLAITRGLDEQAPMIRFNSDSTKSFLYANGDFIISTTTTGAGNTSYSEVLRVTDDQLVGIGGLSTPSAKLHVADDQYLNFMVQSTGAGYAPASVFLRAGNSANRGAGVYSHNSVNDKIWFAGTVYQNDTASWNVCYNGDASALSGGETAVAQTTHRLFNVYSNGDVNIVSGSLDFNDVTVIDSSRHITAPQIRLTSTFDATVSSTAHALQIGPDNDANVVMDANEIMARNNGATSDLHINPDGGGVTVGNNTSGTGSLVVKGTGYFSKDLTLEGNDVEIRFAGGNNRILFSGYRALEGATNGGILQVGEGYTTVQSYGHLNLTSGHAYQVNGTDVITSSREGSFATRASFGGIDSTGNAAPSSNEIVVSGYGTIGNRGTVYLTNSDASGNVQIGVGGAHNANPKLIVSSSGTDVKESLSVQGFEVVDSDRNIKAVGTASSSVPRYSFSGDTNTGLGYIGTDQVGLIAGGSRKFYVSSTGAYFQNLTDGVTLPRTTIAHSQSSGMKLTATDSTANANFYGFHIDYNASGSDTTTSDRVHSALYIDADSSATGGGTSHEHRYYGIYADVRASGDSDLQTGIYTTVRADNFGSDNTVTNLRGGHFVGISHHDAGTLTALYGSYSDAQCTDSGSGRTSGVYGSYSRAYAASTSSYGATNYTASYNIVQISGTNNVNLTDTTAVRGEIQLDNDGAADHSVTITNAFVFRAEFDENDSDDSYTVNNGYLYYGNYAGELPTTAWGVYIADDVPNYFAGTIRTGDGSTSIASYGFNGDTNTGMYSPANHEIGFSTDGGERVRITNDGLAIRNGEELRAYRADNTRSTRVYTDNSYGYLETDVDPMMIKSANRIEFRTNGNDHRFSISNGGTLEIGSANTAILTQDRDLQNINSISSGAITATGNSSIDRITLKASSGSGTGGGRLLDGYYSGDDHLWTLSSDRSSGALTIGYGADSSTSGAESFTSTFDNFSGKRSAVTFRDAAVKFWGTSAAVQTTVGSALTTMTNRITLHTDDGSAEFGGNVTLNKSDGFMYLSNVGTGNAGIYVRGIGASNVLRSHTTGEFRWEILGSQKMMMDSSGRLIVGADAANGDNAVTLNGGGYVYAHRASGVSGYFDRDSSGDVVTVRYGGSPVGHLGIEGNDSLYIQAEGASGVGLRFHQTSGAISPIRNGALASDVVSLGTATQQFNNLHLAGEAHARELFIEKFTNTAGTTGSTLLTLTNYVGTSTSNGDLSQQKTFIDFALKDGNSNETPQVRIGAEVGENSDANAVSLEGSGAFVVYTNDADTDAGDAGSSLTEKLRVDYAGDVHIKTGGLLMGTSTVIDSARDIQNVQAETGTTGLRFKTGAWFYDASNNARFQFVASSHNYYKTDGNAGKHFFFDGNSSTEASADAFIDAGGNGHFAGNVTAYSSSVSSDARLKENIRPIESATETVKQLNGVVFDWKKTERGTDQLGFIAQEIEQVLPSLVTEVDTLKDENTETHKTVNYAALVPMLVESIKELTKRIEELENGNH